MSREVLLIFGLAFMVFCVRFYFECWVNRKITRRLLEYYRNKQVLCPSGVFGFMEYNPFEAVKQVALRAGIVPPELLVVPEYSFGISAFCLGHFIVCSYSFIKDTPEKEFEGVIGHEFGHLINKIEVFFRLARYLFLGFLWCGGFLLLTFLGLTLTRIWEGGFLVSVDFIFLTGFLLCSILFGGVCFSSYRMLGKQREFSADKRALLLTRYPQDFLNRLLKIMFEEALCNESGSVGLLEPETPNTHPPTRKRVKAAKRILEKRGAVK